MSDLCMKKTKLSDAAMLLEVQLLWTDLWTFSHLLIGSHISEVLQENEALRERVEQLQLQSEKDQEELQARAAQAEEELSR